MADRDQRREAYRQKLLDPRWQRRRLEILSRDDFACQQCFGKEATLHVHHRWYEGEPWEAPDGALVTLCEECHSCETHDRPLMERGLLDALRRWADAKDVHMLWMALEETPAAHRLLIALRVLQHDDLHARAEEVYWQWKEGRPE